MKKNVVSSKKSNGHKSKKISKKPAGEMDFFESLGRDLLWATAIGVGVTAGGMIVGAGAAGATAAAATVSKWLA